MTKKYHYVPGAQRWFRHTYEYDVRAHRPPSGWTFRAERRDTHPITGEPLGRAEWWILEEYVGE